MKRTMWVFLVCVTIIISTAWVRPSRAGVRLNVFAAASLADVMQDIAKDYESKTGTQLLTNLGSSATLRLQIEKRMPCDIFFSANKDNVVQLANVGLVDRALARGVLTNSLVVIAPVGENVEIKSMDDLRAFDRIALADPDSVPAGIYAKEAINKAGLWSTLGPSIIRTLDVRSAMVLVEQGNAAVGIVYKTDAAASKKVKVIYDVPADLHQKIEYWVAVVSGSDHKAQAEQFLDYLGSAEAKQIYERFGFKRIL